MKRKIILLLVPLVFLTSCASNKLKRTVWYNVTMMQENGVMGNVGTSLVFNTDSTVVVYKGVSIDTTIVLSPYVFAYGTYQYTKGNENNMNVSVSVTKSDGTPYVYTGEYNKKSGVMILRTPNSQLKETFIWNPKAKVHIE